MKKKKKRKKERSNGKSISVILQKIKKRLMKKSF